MDEGRQTLPENQLRNLFNNLDADIDELLNTDAELTRPRAFMLTCLNWLGYQIDSNDEIYAENLSGKVIDGPGDGGIDFMLYLMRHWPYISSRVRSGQFLSHVMKQSRPVKSPIYRV